MKLTIEHKVKPVNILGRYQVAEGLFPDHDELEVYIDGKLVPKKLAHVILTGLDVLGNRYLDEVAKDMKKKGYKK